MNRVRSACLFLLALLPPLAVRAAECVPTPLTVRDGERLLVVAPHPDDETLGAGGLIQRVRAQGGQVRIVLMTAGDGYVEAVVHETGMPRPRPTAYIAYGEKRLREVRAAVRVLDGDSLRLQFLGFPDGGLRGLLWAHWERSHPERSVTTGASDPPYDGDAIEPNTPYDGADLHRELLTILHETNPTLVVLPDPLDKHPDHRATGLFTMLALDDWVHEGAAAPRMLAYLVHWPDWPPGWDAKGPIPEATRLALALPKSLPQRTLSCVNLELSDGEVATKREALARYGSQQEVMPEFLASFVRRTEPFTVLTSDELHRTGHMIEHGIQARRTAGPRTPTRSK